MIETAFIGGICPNWDICAICIGILIDSAHAHVYLNLYSGWFSILLSSMTKPLELWLCDCIIELSTPNNKLCMLRDHAFWLVENWLDYVTILGSTHKLHIVTNLELLRNRPYLMYNRGTLSNVLLCTMCLYIRLVWELLYWLWYIPPDLNNCTFMQLPPNLCSRCHIVHDLKCFDMNSCDE